MKSFFYLLSGLLVIVVALSGAVRAEVITLDCTSDTRIIKNVPGTNYGTLETNNVYYKAGYTPENIQWTLMDFDLSSLPAGQSIASATLTMQIWGKYTSDAETEQTFDLYRITKDWGETQATWNNATTSQTWTNAGGDFVGTTGQRLVSPYASFVCDVDDASPGTQYNLDITGLVQEWYAGTYSNYGLEIVGPNLSEYIYGSMYNASVFSKECTTASYRPVLTVTTAPIPEPSTLALLAAGLLGLLAYAWRKRK